MDPQSFLVPVFLFPTAFLLKLYFIFLVFLAVALHMQLSKEILRSLQCFHS